MRLKNYLNENKIVNFFKRVWDTVTDPVGTIEWRFKIAEVFKVVSDMLKYYGFKEVSWNNVSDFVLANREHNLVFLIHQIKQKKVLQFDFMKGTAEREMIPYSWDLELRTEDGKRTILLYKEVDETLKKNKWDHKKTAKEIAQEFERVIKKELEIK